MPGIGMGLAMGGMNTGMGNMGSLGNMGMPMGMHEASMQPVNSIWGICKL